MSTSAALEPKAHRTLSHHPAQGFVYISTPTGRRLRPNAHVVIENHSLSKRMIEIDTNSLGYRNREIGHKRGTRLLFLGDSITFGDYLPEKDTFVRLVEGLARSNSLDWETINAGVGAISLENELAILKETGLSLAPDAVIVCYYLNDFHESLGVRIPEPLDRSRLASHLWWSLQQLDRLFQRTTGRLDIKAWRGEFEALLASRQEDQSEDQRQFYSAVLNAFGDWGGAWSPHTWSRVHPWFEEIQDLASKHGFKLFIVAFPVRAQVEASFIENYPQQHLKEFAAALGVPFLDILPMLREAHASAVTPLFYDQSHHTPEGNRRIALAIYDFLLQHIGNQDGTKQPAERDN